MLQWKTSGAIAKVLEENLANTKEEQVDWIKKPREYRRMKILYVLKTNEGARWAYRQAEWIVNNMPGFEFVAVMPSDSTGFALEYKALGCKVIGLDMSLPVRKPQSFFALKRKIKDIIEQEKPDLIHSHFVTTTLMLRLSLGNGGPKRIFQVPGPLHLESPFFRLVDKYTIRKNDYLVGACKWTTNEYLKLGVPKDRVFLNYYGGPDQGVFNSTWRLHEEYNIDRKTPIVGMVSYFYAPKKYLLQFTGLKGHEDFIDAMAIVRKKIPEAKAIIVGSAWGKAKAYEEKVHSYAEKKCPDGIIFTGLRTDVLEIYHEFTVAVHPSHSENVGGAGESLGQIVPTVSTNVGGFPDIVIDGVTGWTVDKKSPEQLAEKIIWMIKNPEKAKEMAERGHDMCLEKFEISVTAGHMAKIYNTIIKS